MNEIIKDLILQLVVLFMNPKQCLLMSLEVKTERDITSVRIIRPVIHSPTA